jgi:hypothetical protein
MSIIFEHDDRKLKEEYFKLKFYKHLREFYINYEYDWIEDFVNDLYGNTSNKEIFEKYRIHCIFEYPEEEKLKNRLVTSGSYSPEENSYTFIFNKDLLENDDDDRLKDDLTKELQHCMVHEDTHRQQMSGNVLKYKIPKQNEVFSDEYLSHPTEIDARAREVASWLKFQGCNIKEAIKRIQLSQDLGEFDEVVGFYHEIGGPVYHKYLAEIYRYFQGED